MKVSIGFSPCPNDTFIFDALVNKKIDTEGLEFDIIMEDVQTLNEMAIEGKLDVSKISYATLPLVLSHYKVLTSGGALGRGVGPLLISKIELPEPAIKQAVIGIPGQNTTANLLFSLAYPEATNKVFLRYDEVGEFVLDSADSLDNIQAVKLGVIIHENRFTYEKRNLVKVVDLGEFWEQQTGYPIPLGGVVIRRMLGEDVQQQVNRLIKQSLAFAWENEFVLNDFIKKNAREMEESVMRDHIKLYVNEYTMDLDEEGKNAVMKFLQIHSSINKLPIDFESIFI